MLLCVTDDPSITFDALIVESLMYDSMTDAFVSCGTLVMLLLSTVMLLIPVVKLMLEWLMLSGPVPLSVMFSKSVQKTLLSRSSVPGSTTLKVVMILLSHRKCIAPADVTFSARVELNWSTDAPVLVTPTSVELSTPASLGPFPKDTGSRLFMIDELIDSRPVRLDCCTNDLVARACVRFAWIKIDVVEFDATSVELSTRDWLATDDPDKFDFTMLELSTVALVMLLPVTDEPPMIAVLLIMESLIVDEMPLTFVSWLTLLIDILRSATPLIPDVLLMLELLTSNGSGPLTVTERKSVQ